MEHLFSQNNDDDENIKINMDELYEQKQKKDLHKVETYNKLLSRIHLKIKTISRQRNNNQWCWYLMPEVLIGAPNYNNFIHITIHIIAPTELPYNDSMFS